VLLAVVQGIQGGRTVVVEGTISKMTQGGESSDAGSPRHGVGGDPRRFQGVQREDPVEKCQVFPAAKPIKLREGLNLTKDKMAVGNIDEAKKLKYFRCQEVGHHQKDCINTPIFYKCKKEGHMAAECVGFHSKAGELKMFGFAILDQGFYNIMIPGAGEVVKASCIIQVL
jgi:hypothetical protein